VSLVRIGSFSSRIEAGIAGGLLESNGIRHTIAGDDIGIFGPGHAGTSGVGIYLLVPEDEADRARRLLDEAGLID
jgi:hypothetical protein